MSRRSTRRQFLAIAGGVVAAPSIIPRDVLAAEGKPGANDRIGLGFIGVGRRGNQLMNFLPKTDEGQIVAAADYDRSRRDEFAAKRDCRAYADFRELLDAKDIDACVIATPDHWHVAPALLAMLATGVRYESIFLIGPLALLLL